MTETRPSAELILRDSDQGDTFADPAAFAHWQRVAGMFASSEVIPQHLRGHLPDVLIGLDLARRLRLNPLSVLQNLYVVKGTPGWKTAFLIALATSAGWDLEWEVEELQPTRLRWKRRTKDGSVDAEGDNLRVRCVMERSGKTKRGLWVSTGQAIAAKWADNEQYTHSTELMLRWRAAAFAIRMYDPNLLLGLPTAEEAADETRERIVLIPESPTPTSSVPTRGVAAVAAALGAPTAPSSSAPGVSGAGGSDSRPEPTTREAASAKPDAGREAELLRGRITAIGKWPVSTSTARAQLREALGIARMSDERYFGAVNEGVHRGYWVTDASLSLFPAPTPPLAKMVEDLPPEPEATWTDPGAPVGEALLSLLMDVQLDVEGNHGHMAVIEAAEAAGLPIVNDEPGVDGAPEPMLRRFLAALRAISN